MSGTHCYLHAEHWPWELQVGWCVPLPCGGVEYINAVEEDLVVLSQPSCHYDIGAVCCHTVCKPLGGHRWYVLLPTLSSPRADHGADGAG